MGTSLVWVLILAAASGLGLGWDHLDSGLVWDKPALVCCLKAQSAMLMDLSLLHTAEEVKVSQRSQPDRSGLRPVQVMMVQGKGMGKKMI